jgi:hypothetical protein
MTGYDNWEIVFKEQCYINAIHFRLILLHVSQLYSSQSSSSTPAQASCAQ